jgi:UDP-N-acetylglucosamine:LPS N-acetylglucosamine transferase/membrane protein DedA with SNARE-associated domain
VNIFFLDALQQYGYPALWLIVFLAAAGLPISGSLLLFASGAFAALGDFNLFILFPVALSAAVMGDNLTYFIGRRVGISLVSWLERQKRFRFVTPQALEKGRVYFRRSAAWAIFITRFLVVALGGPINLVAGLEFYPYYRFLVWDISGQILSVILSLGLGYIFAQSWEEVASVFGAASTLVLALLIVVALSIMLVRRLRQKKPQEMAAQSSSEGVDTPLDDGERAVEKRVFSGTLLSVSSCSVSSSVPEKDGAAMASEGGVYAQNCKKSSGTIPENLPMKTSKPTILILTTHTGGGHLNLAQSLKNLLEPCYTVAIVDPQSPLVERWYAFVSRRWLGFLTWQYAFTNHAPVAFCYQFSLTLLSYGRLRKLIARVQPQLIVTTHAMLSYAIARANAHQRHPVPLVFQLTDLGELHRTWFAEKHADAYLAPTREIFAQTIAQGIDCRRVHLTGRPVRAQFLDIDIDVELSSDARSRTLTAIGFDPVILTIFLQGGAKGSAGVERTIDSLLNIGVSVQIILAVGNNAQLAAAYANVRQVHPLPFTDTIAPYMAAADLIIGKAGASFITEAIMVEKPFLVTAFIPGQETANLRFIEQHNLGWICLEPLVLQELLLKIVHHPALLAEKIEAIQAYKIWNKQVNQDVRVVIDQLLSEKRGQ